MTNEQVFTLGSRTVRARFLTPSAVRITHSAPGQPLPPDRPWLGEVLLPTPAVTPTEARLTVDIDALNVRIAARDGGFVLREQRAPRFGAEAEQIPLGVTADITAFEVRMEDHRVPDGVSLDWATEPGEGFYGWGQWFAAFRRERGAWRLKTRDAIAALQHRETYTAIPVFYSSRGYAVWLLNSHPSQWTLAPERRTLTVDAAGPNADYVVMYGPGYRDLLTTYTALTGRPPLPPRWAFGLMVTGYPQEDQATTLQRATEHRQRQIPLDAVILDYHWEARYHDFAWRKSLFPDPPAFITALRELGLKLGLIVTPFQNARNRPLQKWTLNTLAKNVPAGLAADDERNLPAYEEGVAKGYFAHTDAKWWYGSGGMLDFTHPGAAQWWNGMLRPRYEEGAAFFKNDDGEYLPIDARSHLGMNGREHHNLYGFFYSRAMYEGMAALDDRRPFVYARSAWAGAQRFPAIFLGDQHPEFEHIQRTLRAGLNMGLLGFAHWTADVFGLDGKTTPETHMRYAQWALLNPIARYFIRPPQSDSTRFPWSHGPACEANFRAYTELRYRLLPYYYRLACEAFRTGLPPMRPMMLMYQEDARFAEVTDQLMLGPALLMAPVVQAGATTREVLLPTGHWHDFWTTTSYPGGGAITYPAPLERLPLLVRGGSLLPFGPVVQHISDDHRFDDLELHCYPPYPATTMIYDDDGRTRAYQHGEYWETPVRVEPLGAGARVTVAATHGRPPTEAAPRRVTVVAHRAVAPAAVRVNGAEAPGWTYDAAAQTVRVACSCPLQAETVIEIVPR